MEFQVVQDRPASSGPHHQKAGFPQTAVPGQLETVARASALGLSNLSFDIKALIALEVQRFSTFCSEETAPEAGMDLLGYAINNPLTDLRSLASTCREFWSLCRPLLWENVTVSVKPKGCQWYHCYGNIRVVDFLPSIGWAVKAVTLHDRCKEEEPDFEAFAEAALKVIRLCPNLRACQFDIPYPCPGMVAATEHLLAALPHLHHLSLFNSPALFKSVAEICSHNPIRSIRIDNWDHISAQTLHVFISSFASSVVRLDLDIIVLVDDGEANKLYHLPHLRTLSVGSWFHPTLLQAFSPCVSLATIQMRLSDYEPDYGLTNAWMSGPLPPSLRRVVFCNDSGVPLADNGLRVEEFEGRGIRVEIL